MLEKSNKIVVFQKFSQKIKQKQRDSPAESVTFPEKSSKGGCFFPEKSGKSAFRFAKSNKRERFFLLLFASAKSNQKQTGLRPATSVQNPCGGIIGEI